MMLPGPKLPEEPGMMLQGPKLPEKSGMMLQGPKLPEVGSPQLELPDGSNELVAWVEKALHAERLELGEVLNRRHRAFIRQFCSRYEIPPDGCSSPREGNDLLFSRLSSGPYQGEALYGRESTQTRGRLSLDLAPIDSSPRSERVRKKESSEKKTSSMQRKSMEPASSSTSKEALPKKEWSGPLDQLLAIWKSESPKGVTAGEGGISSGSSSDRIAIADRKLRMKSTDVVIDNQSICSRLKVFVNSLTFEGTIAALILLNLLVICVEAQYRGAELDYKLKADKADPSDEYPYAIDVFEYLEFAFGVLFTSELLLKASVLRMDFLCSLWNYLDTVIVAFWILNTLGTFDTGLNPSMLRVARLARLFRLIRLLKTLAMFDVLHIMVGSLKASAIVLFWSLFMMLIIMVCVGLLVSFLIEPYMTEQVPKDSAEYGLRLKAFEYFGSFSRTLLTMFEVTLGNWVPVARFLHENISEWFGPCMLIYRCIVGFAFVKVITGIFINETFKVAAADDELMIMQKERQIRKHVEKMHLLFMEADDSGDGYLSKEEFYEVMKDPRVKSWLAAMDLEVRDAELVFNLVDDGDAKISAEELVHGFSRLKGAARSMDMVTLLRDCRRTEGLTKKVLDQVAGLRRDIKFSL